MSRGFKIFLAILVGYFVIMFATEIMVSLLRRNMLNNQAATIEEE